MRHAPAFSTALLVLTACALAAFLLFVHRSHRRDAPLLAVAGSAFVAYGLQRGVHMQFLLWIYHALPYVLVAGARLPPLLALGVILTLDWCHAWVANVLRPAVLMQAVLALARGQLTTAATLAMSAISQMRSLSAPVADQPVYRQLGGLYAEGFSVWVVPASIVLAGVLWVCSWRLFAVLSVPTPARPKTE
jgi:hypothetical protein